MAKENLSSGRLITPAMTLRERSTEENSQRVLKRAFKRYWAAESRETFDLTNYLGRAYIGAGRVIEVRKCSLNNNRTGGEESGISTTEVPSAEVMPSLVPILTSMIDNNWSS